MQRKLISMSKRAIGTAAIALLVASAGFSASAAESGDTAAGATATGNMNAGQNNLRPSYKVSSPAPGVVAVTPSKNPASNAPAPTPAPPNQIAPYPPSVPSAQPAGQH